jgi:hypothetical protein
MPDTELSGQMIFMSMQNMKAILDGCAKLKQHPQPNRTLEVSIGISTDLRYLICEKHIAFYSIDGNVISIA